MSKLMIIGVNVNSELNSIYEQEQELPGESGISAVPLDQSIDDNGDSYGTGTLQQQLEKICRCCASEAHNLNSIFDPGDYIGSMLTVFTPIPPHRDDGLPSKICLPCLDSLAKSTSFKQRVETADKMFRDLLAKDLCQPKGVDKNAIGLLAKSLSEINELDIILESDMKHQEVDCIEESSIEISREEEEVLPSPSPSPEPIQENFSYAGSENEEIEHTTGDDDDIKPIIEQPQTRSGRLKRRDHSCYQCSMCESKFSDIDLYIEHSRSHSEMKELFWCSVCNRNFKARTTLEHHYRCHRANECKVSKSEFICKSCDMKFSVENDLYIHGSIHATGSKYICRKCNKKFPDLFKLKRHVPIHFEDKPYKCDVCDKGFPEMAALTRHFRLHEGEKKEKKYICNFCDKRYYDRHSLKVHRRTHTGEKPWDCKECGKKFIDSRLLNSHLKVHKSEKMYACNFCDRRFTHQSTLKTHTRLHTGEKPYVCHVCSKSFVQSSNLNLHLRMHSGERPYKCKSCPRAFASSSTLNAHMRTHTGEKPYMCPKCGKSFARHDLSAHIRTHTGEKPYMCEICPRKFTTSGQLRQHKRSHSEQKPFTCKICKKACSTAASLSRHMKTHNKSKDGRIQNSSEDDPDDQDDELQSDSELNESAVLVNDLLASVAENTW